MAYEYLVEATMDSDYLFHQLGTRGPAYLEIIIWTTQRVPNQHRQYKKTIKHKYLSMASGMTRTESPRILNSNAITINTSFGRKTATYNSGYR